MDLEQEASKWARVKEGDRMTGPKTELLFWNSQVLSSHRASKQEGAVVRWCLVAQPTSRSWHRAINSTSCYFIYEYAFISVEIKEEQITIFK